MIRRLRFRIAVFLFDLAARVYPEMRVKKTGQAHHVGDRWLEWSISNPERR